MSTTSTITQFEHTHSPSISQYDRRVSDHSTADSTYNLRPLSLEGAQSETQAPPDAAEAIPDGGYGWTVVFACGLFLFWTNGYTVTWGVLQTAILRSSYLEVTTSTISFVGSLALGCMVAFGLPAVRLINLFGARRTCIAAVLLLGSGPLLTSFTVDNLGGMFCTAGVLVGIGSSILYTASNSVVVQWFSGRLGLANGLVKGLGGIGATVLPIAAQGLIDKVGLPWAFRTFGLLMLATLLPVAMLLKERAPQGQARMDWSIFRDISFVCLCLAGAVSTFALFVPSFFLPIFAHSIGLSASTGAALVAGFGLATTFGRLVSGFACDRIGALNTLALTLSMNAVSMLAIWPVSSSLAPLVVFAAINGCGNGSFFVAMPTAIAALAGPGYASGAMSIGTSLWAPGYLFGSAIAGILISSTGAAEATSIEPYRLAIFYAGGVALVGGLLALVSRFKMAGKVMKKL